MTINTKKFLKSPGFPHTFVAGSFIPNGSSAIATTYGRGFTVSRTATGEYQVTLNQPFANFVSIVVTGQFASSDTDAHEFLVGDISVANKTFKIQHLKSADTSTTHPVLADISTSGTANKVNFMVVLADSDTPGAGV